MENQEKHLTRYCASGLGNEKRSEHRARAICRGKLGKEGNGGKVFSFFDGMKKGKLGRIRVETRALQNFDTR